MIGLGAGEESWETVVGGEDVLFDRAKAGLIEAVCEF